MQIAKYFASLSLDIDQASVRKVDKTLSQLENKLRKFSGFGKSFGLAINPTIDQKKLEYVIATALEVASNRVTFEISRFSVNQKNLQAALKAGSLGVVGNGGLSKEEWGRRHGEKNSEWTSRRRIMQEEAAIRHQRSLELANLRRAGGSARVMPGASVGGGRGFGGIGLGLMGPVGAAGLAMALGGYGLAQANKKNQQIVSAELGNNAVVGATNGPKSFEWLKQQGNELGFNWLEQAPEFTGFLGSATPLLGYDKSLETYQAFNEFATTRHADPVARKRALKAIQQMAAKGQVMTEELQNQLGDAANFGELPSIFAEAWQKKTGGNKTGADAMQDLKDAMKKGQVKTGDVLPIVTQILRDRAAPTLEISKRSSQSEQARLQNTSNELSSVASSSGVEEGFARIFRTLNAGLSESGGLVKGIAESFNEVTKWADDFLLWPQSFARALDGKDSLVADWLGVDSTLKADWKEIRDTLKEIGATQMPSWLPTLQSTSKEIAASLHAIATLINWKNGQFSTQGPATDVSSPAAIVASGSENFFQNIDKAKRRGQAVYEDPTSPYYQNPELYDSEMAKGTNSTPTNLSGSRSQTDSEQLDHNLQQQLAAFEDRILARSAPANGPITIELHIDPITLGNLQIQEQAQDIANAVALNLEQALVYFPQN